MKPEIFEKYKRIFKTLKEDFERRKAVLKDARDLIGPGTGQFVDDSGNLTDDINYKKMLDGEPADFFDITANGLFSGIASPSTEWFLIGPANPEIKDDYAAKIYCDEVKDRFNFLFNNSNFYPALKTMCNEAPRYGINPLLVENDDKELCFFRNFTIGEYYLGIDSRGNYDKIAREIMLGADKLANEVGYDNLPDAIKREYDEGSFDNQHAVCHLICPNYFGKEGNRAGLDLIDLCWIGDDILRATGFEDNPLAVLAWERKNQQTVWATGPGVKALGDVRELQSTALNIARNEDLLADPPMAISKELKLTSLLPGAHAFTDGDPAKAAAPLFKIDNHIEILEARRASIKQRIRSLSKADIMLIFAQKDKSQMTAREVNAIENEQIMMLGSIYLNVKQTLDNIFARVFAIGNRRGYFPAPPQIMQGTNLKIEYVSNIAKAQKLIALGKMREFLEFVLALTQVPPEVDNLDRDKMINHAADSLGIDAQNLTAPEVLAQNRRAQAQAQAQQEQMLRIQQATEAAQKLGQAKVSPDTALGALTGAEAGDAQ
jgi:hypothetical protein